MAVILSLYYAIETTKLGQNAKITVTNPRSTGTFVPVIIQLKYALVSHTLYFPFPVMYAAVQRCGLVAKIRKYKKCVEKQNL